jgi:hypothetical protein
LKGLRKIALKSNEEQRVSFRITAADLAYIQADTLSASKRVCEDGQFIVQIGVSSDRFAAACFDWRADK